MKILYDISVLGLGNFSPRARTGVFRVIENVARELVSQPDCNLIFCASNDFNSIQSSLFYLNGNACFSAIPFSKPLNFDRKVAIREKRHQLITEVVGVPSLPFSKKWSAKIKIRELLLKEKLYNIYDDQLIHSRDYKQAQVYHSPFFPVPKEWHGTKKKSVFLTCYDIIALLHPRYCDDGIIQVVRDIANSITPETWVLCISQATRNDLLNYLGNRVNPDRVVVTELAASSLFHPFVDKEICEITREKYHIPIDEPYVLSVCTLEPRKNIERVIKAFNLLVNQENIKRLNLVLVGTKGWLFDKIFAEIESSHTLRKRIIVTGYVDEQDLAPLYADALLFAYPSFYEGFGLPPLEAMQCGTPVITSNTSSLPEVVGDAGIMIDPNDTESLCQAMLSIYKSSSLRQELSQKSVMRSKKFSWSRCAEETMKAYKESLRYL